MRLSSAEMRMISRIPREIKDVERKSDREFDVFVKGDYYSGWLPLAMISLLQWDSPEIASMLDIPIDAGWSAVRDSSEETIWKVFDKHVKRTARDG